MKRTNRKAQQKALRATWKWIWGGGHDGPDGWVAHQPGLTFMKRSTLRVPSLDAPRGELKAVKTLGLPRPEKRPVEWLGGGDATTPEWRADRTARKCARKLIRQAGGKVTL